MRKLHSSDFIGTEPVPRLLLKFATPAMVSTSVNCLYNIVDRLYIGRGVGPDALAGLALTFPFMIILMAFGMLVGQGSSAVVSILLGQGRKEDADKVLGQAIAMSLIFVLTCQMLALIFLDQLLMLLGGTEQAIPYAHSYLSIILWGNIFQHLSFGLSNIVRAEGSANKAMYIIILGAVLNIILDPLFIFIFKMGIQGAAYATVISMMASSLWIILHFSLGNGVLRLHWRNIRLFKNLFTKVLAIGMAPCIMQFVHSAVVLVFNHSFKHYAATGQEATLAVGSNGIINSVFMLMLMPSFGIMQGMQPIVGFNYGAQKYPRVRHAFTLAIGLATAFCFVMALLLAFGSVPIAQCFSKDADSVGMTAGALRINSIGLTFIGCGIVTGNYFQSIGRAALSVFLSLSRQVIFLIPSIIILPLFFGLDGIWWSGPVSDTASGFLCATFFLREIARLKKIEQPITPLT